MSVTEDIPQSLLSIALDTCARNPNISVHGRINRLPRTILDKFAERLFCVDGCVPESIFFEMLRCWPWKVFACKHLRFRYDDLKLNALVLLLDSNMSGTNIEVIQVTLSQQCSKSALHGFFDYVMQCITLCMNNGFLQNTVELSDEYASKHNTKCITIALNALYIRNFYTYNDEDIYDKLLELCRLQTYCLEAGFKPRVVMHMEEFTVDMLDTSRLLLFYSFDYHYLRRLDIELAGISEGDSCSLLLSLGSIPFLKNLGIYELPPDTHIGCLIEGIQGLINLETFMVCGDRDKESFPEPAALSEICLHGLKSTKMKCLRFPLCNVNPFVLQCIAGNSYLHQLDCLELCGCTLDIFCRELFDVLLVNADTLCYLDLANNDLGFREIEVLVPVFQEMKELQVLLIDTAECMTRECLMTEVFPRLSMLPNLIPFTADYSNIDDEY